MDFAIRSADGSLSGIYPDDFSLDVFQIRSASGGSTTYPSSYGLDESGELLEAV